MIEVGEGPRALVRTLGNGNEKIILTPSSPVAIRKMMSERHSRMTQFADHNPLLALRRKVSMHEISVLNGGFLFDLEMPIVWKGLTGQEVSQMDRIWVYQLA